MIDVRHLTRRYGAFTAVDDISFSVGEREILGMLGPNGAGKTTALRMITGFLPPSQGQITVAGLDLLRQPVAARRRIGYLPENVTLYPEMRVREYLAYRARLEGLGGDEGKRSIDNAVDRCLLGDVVDQIIGTLSKGYRQRVGLATAILHDPAVLILDEPTVGLDPKQIIAIRELIRELGSQRTLLLSTHILPEVELLCDRVQIIDGGRIVAEGTSESLQAQWLGHNVLRVRLKDAPADAQEGLASLPGVVSVTVPADEPGRYAVECEGTADLREPVFHLAVERGWVLLELTQAKASLEDIFVRLTTRERDGEGGELPSEEPALADEEGVEEA